MPGMRRRGPLLLVLLALVGVLALGHDHLLPGLLTAGGGGSAEERSAGEPGDGPAGGARGGGPTLAGAERAPRPPGPEADAAARAAAEAARKAEALLGRVAFGGTLTDAAGRPVGGAQIVIAGDLGGSAVVRSADDGSFRADVRPGRYDVLVTAPGRGMLHLEDVVIDASTRLTAELALAPPSRLALTLLRGGRGVEGAPVSLALTRWRWEGEAPAYAVSTDASGQAVFPDLVAGTWQLEARVPDGPVLRQSYEVKQDLELRVVIPDAVEVQGRVTDAATQAPVAGATVRLSTAADKGPSLEVTALSGPDGLYRVAAPKGTPQAFAVEAPGFAPYPHPRDAGRVLASLKPLAAGAGPVERDVALSAGGSVAGRVLTRETRQPVPGVRLLFRPRRGTPVGAESGEEGRYAVPHLNPGPYDVAVESPGWYPVEPLRVTVPAGATEPVVLDVPVEGARTIAGTVTLAEGGPVGGARVWLTGGGQILRSARGAGRALETFTTTDGRFSLTDVPPSVALVVRAALGGLEATPVGVAADRPPPDPLRLVLAATGTLSGRVLELGRGTPIPGARVTLRPEGAPFGREARTATSDAEGRFRFELLIPGEVGLAARHGAYLLMESLPARVEPDEEARVELLLDPGLVVAGFVLDADGRGLPARVRVSGNVAETGQGVSRAMQAGPDGGFRLTGFQRGQYRLRVDASGFRGQTLENLAGGEDRLRLVLVAQPPPGN